MATGPTSRIWIERLESPRRDSPPTTASRHAAGGGGGLHAPSARNVDDDDHGRHGLSNREVHLLRAVEALQVTVLRQRGEIDALKAAVGGAGPRPVRHQQTTRRPWQQDDEGETPAEGNSIISSTSSTSSSQTASVSDVRGSGADAELRKVTQRETRSREQHWQHNDGACPTCHRPAGYDDHGEDAIGGNVVSAHLRDFVDREVRRRLSTYAVALDEKLARSMARRVRQVTRSHVESSVDRELRRCLQRHYFADDAPSSNGDQQHQHQHHQHAAPDPLHERLVQLVAAAGRSPPRPTSPPAAAAARKGAAPESGVELARRNLGGELLTAAAGPETALDVDTAIAMRRSDRWVARKHTAARSSGDLQHHTHSLDSLENQFQRATTAAAKTSRADGKSGGRHHHCGPSSGVAAETPHGRRVRAKFDEAEQRLAALEQKMLTARSHSAEAATAVNTSGAARRD